MRIVGETIVLVTREGGGIDDDGYPLPEKEVNVEIRGAVFIPEGNGTILEDDRSGEYRQASILLPTFQEISTGAEVIVRGLSYKVDRPPVDHRSVFGTSLGGTEIYLKRVTG